MVLLKNCFLSGLTLSFVLISSDFALADRYFPNPKINGVLVGWCADMDRFGRRCNDESAQYNADKFCQLNGYSYAVKKVPHDRGWNRRGRQYRYNDVWHEGKYYKGWYTEITSLTLSEVVCR